MPVNFSAPDCRKPWMGPGAHDPEALQSLTSSAASVGIDEPPEDTNWRDVIGKSILSVMECVPLSVPKQLMRRSPTASVVPSMRTVG